jgi:hypothetical protein
MIVRIATIAALVLGSAVVLGPAAPAGACTCVGMTDVEALASAEVAFTGELVEVQEPAGVEGPSDAVAWFVFAVDTVYKGDAVSRQAVVTARDSASCGLEISGPGPFLVFASTEPDVPVDGRDGDLYSSLCSGTRPVAAGDLPAAFGPGHRAQDASPPAAPARPHGADDTADRWGLVAVAGVAGAVVLAALAVWVGVRRRSGGVGGAREVSGSDR